MSHTAVLCDMLFYSDEHFILMNYNSNLFLANLTHTRRVLLMLTHAKNSPQQRHYLLLFEQQKT